MSSEALSFFEQAALQAVVVLIQKTVKNPTSKKARAVRVLLVDLGTVIELALAKIPGDGPGRGPTAYSE